MKNAIILHGSCDAAEYYDGQYPSLSNSHWIPWLQKQLLTKDYSVATPEVAGAHEPTYKKWLDEFVRYDISDETVLVGHSYGAGFLIRWLSENKDCQVAKVFLVAPSIDPDRLDTTDFFDFTIDKDLASRTEGITIYYSDNDEDSVQKSLVIIRNNLNNARYREFQGYGHFSAEEMESVAFPELLEEILA